MACNLIESLSGNRLPIWSWEQSCQIYHSAHLQIRQRVCIIRDFFKPWRRKIGLATLVMACVFMSGWVRSEMVSEIILIPINTRDAICIVSSHGRLSVQKDINQPPPQPAWSTMPVSKIRNALAGKETQWPSIWVFYKLQGAHFPYWLIVIPLTVVSVCLLHSFSLKSKRETADLLVGYFQNSRRKWGAAMLLATCLFLGVWARGQFHEDRFSIPVGYGMNYGLILLRDGICLSKFRFTSARGFQWPSDEVPLLVIPYWITAVLMTLVSAGLLIIERPKRSRTTCLTAITPGSESS